MLRDLILWFAFETFCPLKPLQQAILFDTLVILQSLGFKDHFHSIEKNWFPGQIQNQRISGHREHCPKIAGFKSRKWLKYQPARTTKPIDDQSFAYSFHSNEFKLLCSWQVARTIVYWSGGIILSVRLLIVVVVRPIFVSCLVFNRNQLAIVVFRLNSKRSRGVEWSGKTINATTPDEPGGNKQQYGPRLCDYRKR